MSGRRPAGWTCADADAGCSCVYSHGVLELFLIELSETNLLQRGWEWLIRVLTWDEGLLSILCSDQLS